ncbi:HEPN domain-containing protein [Rhizobium laguerreae]|uniref:HEPN domain-containing protein n=1 Tax=Rhizobium laguerreae TaxID=1076926 RepID=UPI0010409AE8|nr:HEPN domain-containing protein [Rhizobium laguerreae]TBX98428.1 HEPN domain-containing protein [Rhizobium laguerreae]
MAKRMIHPPKDKKQNKPRKEQPEPLSQMERLLKARQEFSKSLIHLDEAKKLAAWRQAPNACVHSAYYAMYHTATAVILTAGGVGKRGDAPASHVHIVEHFGKIVAKQRPDLESLGLTLNRARQDRMVSDYGLVEGATDDEAIDLAQKAADFIKTCRETWDLKNGRSFLEEIRALQLDLTKDE